MHAYVFGGIQVLVLYFLLAPLLLLSIAYARGKTCTK